MLGIVTVCSVTREKKEKKSAGNFEVFLIDLFRQF
jgi:hypothetical protein